ncbi:uncharacterized protein [Haliotis asinina]|uniref:uncharacterized protein n=1 Tax=Haliotis asinina TaxID=109174 RepID=UPI0035321ADF
MLSVDLVAMLLASLSIAFQLSGLLTPGWWIVETRTTSNQTVKYGIWRTISCVDDDCTEKVTDATGTFAWLQVTKVFEVGAAVFAAAAVACYVLSVFKNKWSVVLYRLFVCLMAGAGSAILVGIAVFAKKCAGLTRYPKRDTAGGRIDWPMGLSAVAAILCFVDAVVVGLFLRTKKTLSEMNLMD